MLMPEWCTFHNTIFDIRCSKCKRTQENHFFVKRGKVYKACNACRDKAARGRLDPEFVASVGGAGSSAVAASRHIPDSDSENEPSMNPRAALYALGFNYNDANHEAAVDESLALSSSAAAASSSSSAGYFVDEPDPEPEPGESEPEGPKGS